MKEAEAVCPWKTRTLRGSTAFRDAKAVEAEGRVTETEGETVKLAKQNSTMSKKVRNLDRVSPAFDKLSAERLGLKWLVTILRAAGLLVEQRALIPRNDILLLLSRFLGIIEKSSTISSRCRKDRRRKLFLLLDSRGSLCSSLAVCAALCFDRRLKVDSGSELKDA